MHRASIISAFSVVVAFSAGVALKVNADPPAMIDASHWLARGHEALSHAGFVIQPNIQIVVNDRNVAYGYRHPACTGLLLLTAIPDVARTWAQLAPELDLSDYRQSLYYNGLMYEALPRWDRAFDKLVNRLSFQSSLKTTQLFGFAEKGNCNFTEYAHKTMSSSLQESWMDTYPK